MKRTTKIIAALALALLLIARASVSAATTHSVTINNSTTGHTYEAYQIFTGDLSTDKATLSNIQWGANISSTYSNGKNPTTIANYIEQLKAEDGTTARTAAEWAAVLENYLTGNPAGTASTPANGVYTISNLADGYYLIKDTDGSLTGVYDAYTEFILKLVGDATVDPKSGVPAAEKLIDEDTDVANSANYRAGDTVKFILKGTMPSNYASYSSYKYNFHDKLPAGLTLDASSIKVYVGSTEITSGFTINTSPSDNDSFDVVFANTKAITSITAQSEIYVKYNTTVNGNATVGGTGNGNELKIEFSNNPNDPTEVGGITPVKKASVFLYNIILNKKDQDGNPLSGVTLKLERLVGNDYQEVTTISNTTTFTFDHLGLGTYRLTEAVTPNGYNTIDPVTIVVTGSVDGSGFTALSGTGLTFTADLANGTLTADVINVRGSNLPFTGGIGTTIFTVAGIGLVAGAIFILTRKNSDQGAK